MTVMLPTFIEVVDTSVVNVSLPYIQGSLSAGLDQVTWVLTSYLVSNAIIIPITGWLSNVFGRKRYLLFSITLFTGSSIVCGAAPSLAVLVGFRVLQGLGGGGLQPLSQAILLESFPPAEQGMAMAFFGMGVVIAPVIGPVLGGWITDNWSWRWIFYVNVPIGVLAIFLALLFIHDPPYIRRGQLRIDRWGLFFLAVGLGSLQIVLDKGQRDDWFQSDLIRYMTAISVVSLISFIVVELKTAHPVVNLRAFRDRSFASGNLVMFTGFFCLFGSIVLIPLFLQELLGYTAFWAGLVLGPGGISAFMMMPLAGSLMRKGANPKYLLAAGLAIMAYALWQMSGFDLNASFSSVAWPRFIQGFGLGLFFVPLTTATFSGIPKEEIGNASGIFNLLRNLGGSCGTAFGTTMLAQRAQVHQNFLVERVTPYNPAFQKMYEDLSRLIQGTRIESAGTDPALLAIYQQVMRQANMLAFNDTFWLMAVLTALLVPLTVLFRKPKPGAQQVGGMH